MANIPDDRSYSKDHEWVLAVGGGRIRMGITDHAQKQLGDIVYVELPKADDRFEVSEPFGSVESVKAVSEVYVPASGAVAAVNDALNDSPESVNEDPYGDGWMIEITPSDPSWAEGLLTAEEYGDYIAAESAE